MLFVKYLLKKRHYKAGRNSTGRIACRHHGGSLTKRFFLPNFRRRIYNTLGEVLSIRREHVRSGYIALVYYREYGVYEYILCPHKIKKGFFVVAFNSVIEKQTKIWFTFAKQLVNLGNSFLLKNLKIGTRVFNIERFPGNGGKLVRAAGTSAKLLQKIVFGLSKIYVTIGLKSGKIFYLKGECTATLGQCSNPEYNKKSLKKAGRARNLGIRPSVRGVAMNPIDHPHGGGEGKTSGGRTSVSLWGKLTKGGRTLVLHKRKKMKRHIQRMRFGRALK
jgi:large subunit ribosomal protein L2